MYHMIHCGSFHMVIVCHVSYQRKHEIEINGMLGIANEKDNEIRPSRTHLQKGRFNFIAEIVDISGERVTGLVISFAWEFGN